MKDVTNRKLFQKRDARNKLRQMGGIMSSSPELMSTVQKFSVGSGPMGVQAPKTLADLFSGPKVDRPEITNPFSLPDFSSDPYMQNPGRVIENYLFPETRVRDIAAAENVGATGQTRSPVRRPSEFIEYENENELLAGVMPPEQTPAAREATAEANENELLAGVMPPEQTLASSPQTDAELAADARDSAPVVPQRKTEKPDPSTVMPDPNIDMYGVEEQVKQGDALRKQMADFFRNPKASEKDKNDAGLELAGYKHPDEELSVEKRAKANAEMFRRIMGRDPEEDKKIDGYNLAMLGFLIASGDSPNALQNIARGAAAGVKNFQDTAKARQAREEKIKMAGLEKVIRDDETAKKVEIEERRIERGYEFENLQKQIESSDRQVELRTRLGFERVKLEAQLNQQRELAEADNISEEARAEARANVTMLSSLYSAFGPLAAVALGESDGTPEGVSRSITDVINSPEKMEKVEELAKIKTIGKSDPKGPLAAARQVQELGTGTDAIRFQQLAEDQFAEAGVRDPSSTQVANLAQVLRRQEAADKPLPALPKVGSTQVVDGVTYTVTGFNNLGQPLYTAAGE
jgi:hypothetical protein